MKEFGEDNADLWLPPSSREGAVFFLFWKLPLPETLVVYRKERCLPRWQRRLQGIERLSILQDLRLLPFQEPRPLIQLKELALRKLLE